jgi:hypothetical protein
VVLVQLTFYASAYINYLLYRLPFHQENIYSAFTPSYTFEVSKERLLHLAERCGGMQQMCASLNSTYNLYYSKDKRGGSFSSVILRHLHEFVICLVSLQPINFATATATFRDGIDFFDEEN